MSRRKKWLGIVIVAWLGAAIWLVGFATVTVDGTRLTYAIDGKDLSDEQITYLTRRRIERFIEPWCRTDVRENRTLLDVFIATTDPVVVLQADEVLHFSGDVRFMVMAEPTLNQAIVPAAKTQADTGSNEREVDDESGKTVARWISVNQRLDQTTGRRKLRVDPIGLVIRDSQSGNFIDLESEIAQSSEVDSAEQWMAQQGVDRIDVLAIVEPELVVDANSIEFASSTMDQTGNPSISLTFTEEGGQKLGELTTKYSPVGKQTYRLGIIMDDELLSAPSIFQAIGREAMITGNFLESETRNFVRLIGAGNLTFEVSAEPVETETTRIEKPFFSWR